MRYIKLKFSRPCKLKKIFTRDRKTVYVYLKNIRYSLAKATCLDKYPLIIN